MLSSNTSAANGAANYIEDVFSTWLYSGAAFGSGDIPIPNGIDLSGEGGLVWTKGRSVVTNHFFTDTVRGGTKSVFSNLTNAEATNADLIAFNNNGFTLGSGAVGWDAIAGSGKTYASWTFRKQPKFFDVVTWTGDGVSTGRVISHSLTSAPGSIIARNYSSASNWQVYHRSLSLGQRLTLNSTSAASVDESIFGNGTTGVAPTSTGFTVGISLNVSGQTYVAYLFAHNAGGFGLTGTDNVISCGSFTTDGSGNATVDLGHEPQFVITKRSSSTGDWWLMDVMRGMPIGANNQYLNPNLADAEGSGGQPTKPSATGFTVTGTNASSTFIYIAIRRGPMKVPTSGTSVFSPYQVPASPTTGAITGFVTDAGFIGSRTGADKFLWGARLMGNPTINSTSTAAESANTNQIWDRMNGWWNTAINNYMTWGFARAPGFMDVCCYTGTGVARTVAHNLGVAPELMIVKSRNRTGEDWPVYHSGLGTTIGSRNLVYVNKNLAATTNADGPACFGNGTTIVAPTSSVFTVGTQTLTNALPDTYVAYLFASCPGVQSIQSYVGDGTTGRTINCGFTGGARFVCIKATSTTGSWWTFDSARGIVTNNDPALQLNSTAAEVTSADAVDTAASGFIVNQEATCSLNASGVTYLVWAIA